MLVIIKSWTRDSNYGFFVVILKLIDWLPQQAKKIFHLQQSNMERVGKFSFTNRLNDIIPLLSDRWLDESEKQMKKTLKTKILDIVPAKCDS